MTNNGRLAQKWEVFPAGFNGGSGRGSGGVVISNQQLEIINLESKRGTSFAFYRIDLRLIIRMRRF